jgi:lysophospholipase L1-like esterase
MIRRLSLVLLLALTSCVIEQGSGDTPLLPGQAGGATPTVAPTPRSPRGGPLLAIGDSLLVGAVEHGGLGLKLTADQWEPEVVAETGRSTRWAIDQVRKREKVPRYIVVVMGSNPGYSSAGFADEVQTLRDALVARGARRILWIPPHHPDPNRYGEKDSILQEADRADPRLVVPDWGAVLDQNPEWVGGDGIHLTEAGYDALASYIRDVLGRI